MIATTIMISINVKPERREVLILMVWGADRGAFVSLSDRKGGKPPVRPVCLSLDRGTGPVNVRAGPDGRGSLHFTSLHFTRLTG
jgi:hypothetical protein